MQYPVECIKQIEGTYSSNYLSEGGDEATLKLFQGLDVPSGTFIDIGSGLGGSAFCVAKAFDVQVLGLEVNHDLVAMASSRIPSALKHQVQFQYYEDVIPCEDSSVDLIYSKGVLVHLEDLGPCFKA